VSGTAQLFLAKWQCTAAPVDPLVAGEKMTALTKNAALYVEGLV
jgi:hypothetical protein